MAECTGADSCGRVWTGRAEAHCAACHRSFSGDSAFDHHRVGPFEPPDRRTCADPATRGLELVGDVWRWPGSNPVRRPDQDRRGAPGGELGGTQPVLPGVGTGGAA